MNPADAPITGDVLEYTSPLWHPDPGGGGGAHDILSATHTDTDAADVPAVGDVLGFVAPGEWEAIPPPAGTPGATPTQIDIGDAQVGGADVPYSRNDHGHAFPAPGAGYPVDVAAAEGDGTGTTPARSDHGHAHGSGYLANAHHNQDHGSADHSGAVLPGEADENLGDHFLDVGDIATPSNPGAGVRRLFDDTGTGELSVRTSAGATVSLEGGGGGAPTNAQYVVVALNGTLTDERVLTPGTGLDLTDGGAGGNATLDVDTSEFTLETLIQRLTDTLVLFERASPSHSPPLRSSR